MFECTFKCLNACLLDSKLNLPGLTFMGLNIADLNIADLDIQ
jgi:hypothetical protein